MMKVLFAASVLASLTSAVPMHGLNKRAVQINTVTHTTWTTVDVTTTVFINDADPTPPPEVPVSSVTSVPTSAPPSETSTPAASPANFVQEQQQPSSAAYTPPAYTPPASSAAPAPPTESAANPVPKASSGGPCEGQGSACSGDITFYNGAGGYGACGGIIDDSAFIVALPHGLMGTQSNGNPYCGRTVSIKGTDGSIHKGTVEDKCMGCDAYSIDLTPALFQAVAPNGDGRVAGIDWWLD